MKGNSKVLEHLNRSLGNELIAINQYFLHARMFESWGYPKLGEFEYKASIDEMKDADAYVKRILFLEGVPNLQDLGKLFIGENVKEAFELDLQLEYKARNDLQDSIHFLESEKDFISRDMMTQILQGEEHHIDWLETQIELMEKIGMENYLQSQIGES